MAARKVRRRGGGGSGDGRNKYLKERLPSQLHRAEMWKRQSKQAWSLGWLGGVVGEKKKEREKDRVSMKQKKEMERAQAEARRRRRREKGSGEDGQQEKQNDRMQNNSQ